MTSNPDFPQLYPNLPVLSGDNVAQLRQIMRFLSRYGIADEAAQDTLARLAAISDDAGVPIFADPSPTAPEVVLAKQLSHTAAMSMFYASNIPLLLEDYLLTLTGEQPYAGTPEYVWVVHRLTATRNEDYTISAGREMVSDNGAMYASAYPLTIPAGHWGDEVVDGGYPYQQLYKARTVGLDSRVSAESLTRQASSVAYVDFSRNPRASFGGRDNEAWPEFRVRAFQTPSDGLLVTTEDYERATSLFLGPRSRAVVIGRSRSNRVPVPNQIRLAAVFPNGELVTMTSGGAALLASLNARSVDSDVVLEVPQVTGISLRLEVILESFSSLDDETVRRLLTAQIAARTNASAWEDWGEEENQFSAVRLLTQIGDALGGVDRIHVTAMSVTNEGGVLEAVPPYDDVTLEPVIGLPGVTVADIVVIRERA